MAASWDVTFGPLLRGLAEQISQIPIGARIRKYLGLGLLASGILTFEANMRRSIGDAVGKMAGPLAAVFIALRHAFVWPVRQLQSLATDTAEALWGLRTVVIPAMIAAKVGWIPRHLAALSAEVARIAARAPSHIVHKTVEITKPIVKVAISTAGAVTLPRIHGLEHDLSDLAKRLRELAKRAPVALTAAALTAIVARTAFRWVRCSRVTRAGKHICGMNEQAFSSLLQDTALIVGTISLVEFAHGMQSVMDEIAPPVRHFWTADVRDRVT